MKQIFITKRKRKRKSENIERQKKEGNKLERQDY